MTLKFYLSDSRSVCSCYYLQHLQNGPIGDLGHCTHAFRCLHKLSTPSKCSNRLFTAGETPSIPSTHSSATICPADNRKYPRPARHLRRHPRASIHTRPWRSLPRDRRSIRHLCNMATTLALPDWHDCVQRRCQLQYQVGRGRVSKCEHTGLHGKEYEV